MLVARAFPDVALVDVVSPHGVERSDIASHSRHERCEQRSEAEAEHSGWEESDQHHRHREIVVENDVSCLIEKRRTGRWIDLGRNDSLPARDRE